MYLKGLSTGDFSSALTALLGRDAPGLSAATVSRLKEVWKEQYQRWSQRSLAGKNYVYIWVDGVHFGVRLEDASQCIGVSIAAWLHSDPWFTLIAERLSAASPDERASPCLTQALQ